MGTEDLATPAEFVAEAHKGFNSVRVLRRQLAARVFPPGVAIRIGGRWLIAREKMLAWVVSGGNLLDDPARPANEARQ